MEAAAHDASLTLSAQDRETFARQGYLIRHQVVPRAFLAALDRDMEVGYQQKIRDPALTVEEVNNSHGLGKDNPHAIAMSRDPRMLELIQDLVYPGIELFSAKVISKGPRELDMICHWHQDEAYWYDGFPRERRLSVWMPLQDVDAGNGCLRVVPGSHRDGVVPHQPRSSRDHGACRLSFADGREELPGAIELPLPAGSLILFSSRLQHSSLGNRSNAHRRAFILTYQEVAAGAESFEVLRPAPQPIQA
jgi:phytanoyl-CoA hydroxylase